VLVWTLLNAVTTIVSLDYFPVIYTAKMLAVCVIPFWLFWFLLHFTETRLVNSRVMQAVVFIIPVIDCLGVITNPFHHLYFLSYDYPIPPRNIAFIVHNAADVVFLLAAYVFLFRYIIKNIRRRPFLIVTGIGALFPYVLNTLYSYNLVSFKHDTTPIAFFFTLMIFVYSSYYSRMFHSRSAILRNAFDSIADVIVIINREGFIVDANNAIKKRFPGFIPVFGKTTLHEFVEFLRKISNPNTNWMLLNSVETLHKENFSGELDLLADGNTVKTFELTWHMVHVARNKYSYVLVFDDVSDYHAMISEINKKNINLAELKDTAEEASRAKSRFLAQMSHEIRTPMNAILGMSELALRENIPPAAQEHLGTIKQAGINLLSIINDILDFSKIEAGKMEIACDEYLFSSLIYDVINIFKTKMNESRLQFIVFLDGNIPNYLYGDSARIRQIMLNILSNAVKYTEKGFVSLSVTVKSKESNNAILAIEVGDSGRGIKQEEINKLFSEFERLNLAQNKSIEGTGLGLSITKNLVDLMGGSIDIHSEYGKGSVFTVSLPQEARQDTRIASVKNPEEKNILIFERRQIYAESICKSMDNLGVKYKLALDISGFNDDITGGKYPYVFIAAALYEEVKNLITELNSSIKFVLIADFGEVIDDKNISVITMPVFSIPIANFLNGGSEPLAIYPKQKRILKIIAPEANVMVVDDIITNLKVAEGLLLPYKLKITLCKNGIQALKAVTLKHYDLILMDHMMPEMDGIEAAAKIREMSSEVPYFENIPIIALTANAVSGTREMFLEKGFNDYLSKPIDIAQLDSVLKMWIPREKQKKHDEEENKVL
jgi:signal transduction histidine kinase/AmiR/NasT family two-component response regulator